MSLFSRIDRQRERVKRRYENKQCCLCTQPNDRYPKRYCQKCLDRNNARMKEYYKNKKVKKIGG